LKKKPTFEGGEGDPPTLSKRRKRGVYIYSGETEEGSLFCVKKKVLDQLAGGKRDGSAEWRRVRSSFIPVVEGKEVRFKAEGKFSRHLAPNNNGRGEGDAGRGGSAGKGKREKKFITSLIKEKVRKGTGRKKSKNRN